ncbi:hypothetical protein CAGA_19820 [Caproiciproducens galactitolivorans]|uniref:Uncharacterized protein n=1 Tax=Caproiciproducens galactitolivorans TaxID=642589 RepID=A0A4Z0YDX5_9FIRM|nr:hypothetical protein CAGA_19820 [Caproiciproducens galactitolivorans]
MPRRSFFAFEVFLLTLPRCKKRMQVHGLNQEDTSTFLTHDQLSPLSDVLIARNFRE